MLITRQHILTAAQEALAAWGYQALHLVGEVSSARLLPGEAYSSHWLVQFQAHKGTDTHTPPVYVRLIVQESLGRLFGRDHEESNTPFAGPLLMTQRQT
jgi:hypothetical protein